MGCTHLPWHYEIVCCGGEEELKVQKCRVAYRRLSPAAKSRALIGTATLLWIHVSPIYTKTFQRRSSRPIPLSSFHRHYRFFPFQKTLTLSCLQSTFPIYSFSLPREIHKVLPRNALFEDDNSHLKISENKQQHHHNAHFYLPFDRGFALFRVRHCLYRI